MFFKRVSISLLIGLALTGKATGVGQDESDGELRILTKLPKPVMAMIADYLSGGDRRNLFLISKAVHNQQIAIEAKNINTLVGACTRNNSWSKKQINFASKSTLIRNKALDDFQKALKQKIEEKGFGFLPQGTVLSGYTPIDLHVTDHGTLCEEDVLQKLWAKVFYDQPYNEKGALTHLAACLPLLSTLKIKLSKDQAETLIRHAAMFAQKAQKDRPFYSFNPAEINEERLKSKPHQILVDDEQMKDRDTRQALEAILRSNEDHLLVVNVGKDFVTDGVLKNFALPKTLRHLKIVNPRGNVTSIWHNFLSCCDSLEEFDGSSLIMVKAMGNLFLQDCKKLTKVDISGLTNLESIGHQFLSYCVSLQECDASGLIRLKAYRELIPSGL